MATTDWQTGLSTLERQAYMFDNQLYTDVLFEVGPEGGEARHVSAHKYVLISNSPVFEAMLCGRMREGVQMVENRTTTIRITDVDIKSFTAMLR